MRDISKVGVTMHAIIRWRQRFCRELNLNLLRLALSRARPARPGDQFHGNNKVEHYVYGSIIFVIDPESFRLITVYRPNCEHFRATAERRIFRRRRRSGASRIRPSGRARRREVDHGDLEERGVHEREGKRRKGDPRRQARYDFHRDGEW